jgi:hypothetical protein
MGSNYTSTGALLFGAPNVHKPKASDLYGGPRAFSGYQPNAATAGRENEQYTRNAMGTLGQIANTGWSDADRAANQQAMRDVARNEAGQRGAVMQQAQQRGTLTGGNTFLAGLLAQQEGANRNMENATSLQVAGANRRQGAAMGMAGLGQQLTQNDMARAQAADQFNQWASGMQAQAVQGQYEAEKSASDSWWHRISGGML